MQEDEKEMHQIVFNLNSNGDQKKIEVGFKQEPQTNRNDHHLKINTAKNYWKNQRSYTVGPPSATINNFDSRNNSLDDHASWNNKFNEFDERVSDNTPIKRDNSFVRAKGKTKGQNLGSENEGSCAV